MAANSIRNALLARNHAHGSTVGIFVGKRCRQSRRFTSFIDCMEDAISHHFHLVLRNSDIHYATSNKIKELGKSWIYFAVCELHFLFCCSAFDCNGKSKHFLSLCITLPLSLQSQALAQARQRFDSSACIAIQCNRICLFVLLLDMRSSFDSIFETITLIHWNFYP